MDIFSPPRLTTLEPQKIQVVVHGEAEEDEILLENVFPFETIFAVKQRLAVLHDGDKTWMPNMLFVAQETPEGYESVEFEWPFGKALQDPLDPVVLGKPDPRIYTPEGRKAIFPKVYSGITVESGIREGAAAGAGGGAPRPRALHIWKLATIVRSTGLREGTLPSDPMFEGFLQLYFPMITRQEEIPALFTPLSAKDREAFRIMGEFREMVEARYAKLEQGIKLPSVQSAPPFSLKELRMVVFSFPKLANFSGPALELKFYEIKPSEQIPFIRYFSSQERVAPLIQLATHPTGGARIQNPRLLDMLMADQPNTENGSVLVLKHPIVNETTPLGTTWTLKIQEDGSALLTLGAPRRDAPLQSSSVSEALKRLPAFLAETPYAKAPMQLIEFTGTYSFKTTAGGGKPAKQEFRKRMDPFLPVFQEEKTAPGDTAALTLRYKAVSNFVADKDPIMGFITNLFIRDSTASIEAFRPDIYVKGIVAEYGVPATEAAEMVAIWLRRHAEYVVGEGAKATAAYNVGSFVRIYNSHPNYLFSLANAESEKDIRRMLTLLSLLTTEPSERLRLGGEAEEGGAAAAAAAAAAEEFKEAEEEEAAPPPANEKKNAQWAAMMNENLFGFGAANNAPEGVEETAEELVQETAPVAAAPAAPEAAVRFPDELGEDEIIPPLAEKWYVDKLQKHDVNLVKYETTGTRLLPYTRCCQANNFRQPNVMSAEVYHRARTLYGDAVFWLEAPLNPTDEFISVFAGKTIEERKKISKKKSPRDLIEMEKRALTLGFPLKVNKEGNASITLADTKTATAEDKAEIQRLMQAQAKKPLWVVVRTGTVMNQPNYYVCAELWCVRDDLPLIRAEFEFEGVLERTGRAKRENTCAFCGGRKIINRAKPVQGETVIERNPTVDGKMMRYAGFLNKLQHPAGYALPCCFTDPDNLIPPDGAKPIPPPVVPLPDLQRSADAVDVPAVPVAPAAPEAEEEEEEEEAPVVDPSSENRARPFTAKRAGGQNKWYIPHQNILGRKSIDWFELERGAAAVPPASVNALFGQNPEKFLTKNKGILGEKINSYLTFPATAFVRYSIGGNQSEPGENLLSLIGFAQYATNFLLTTNHALAIPSPKEVLALMDQNEFALAHAFEQANYGTLVREFSTGSGIPAGQEVEFQTWCGKMGLHLTAGQRAYAESLFIAWNNFKNYYHDTKTQKELRIWEGLLAVPGLLTKTGCIIVKIRVPKNKDESATIECPQFGISLRDQAERPPILFVIEDAVTRLYDPLVLYEGISKEERHLLGVLQMETEQFGALSSAVREPIQAFITQYFSPLEGCGRSVSPTHPWVPVRDATLVPRLGMFNSKTYELEFMIESLLRDRSNRLAGVLVRHKPYMHSPLFFIPCVDDGTILFSKPSQYGEEALPRPPLEALLVLLIGAQKKVSEKRPGSEGMFPGLAPVRLIADGTNFTALELRCGAVIPFEPFLLTSTIKHPKFAEMKKAGAEIKTDMPWDTDIALLAPTVEGSAAVEQTSEEILDESYQYLRISFSNWMDRTDEGKRVQKQIELLRQARTRLPLWELQKRLDVLLTPFVSAALTQEGTPATGILRRDCLQIQKEGDCTSGCSWSGGRCLIHTTATPRYLDPVRVLTARLTDELLRTFGAAMELLQRRVSQLKPLKAGEIVQADGGMIFSASGRGSESLYDKLGYTARKPGAYTRGLTYPEEVAMEGAESVVPADWEEILRVGIFGADVARDPLAKMTAAIVRITGAPIQALEAKIGHKFTGTLADWAEFARATEHEVITTQLDPKKQQMKAVEWLRGYVAAGPKPTPRQFIVLDLNGIPLQRVADGKYGNTYEQLPEALQIWLDSYPY